MKQRSNLTEGIAQLTAAIEKYSPQRAEYYLELADALQNNGQLAKALPVYREAVRRNPNFAVGLQKLGTALRRSGQYAEAAEVLKRAASIAPEVAVTWHELGLTYRSLGRSADAVAAIGKASSWIRICPRRTTIWESSGSRSGEQARAESAFREAIRIRPDYADAHGNLANLLSGAGKFAQARDAV